MRPRSWLARPQGVVVTDDVVGERLGVEAEDALSFMEWVQGLDKVRIDGVYAYMHVSGGPQAERLVRWQFGRFQSAMRNLDDRGVSVPIRMTASSKTLTLTGEMNLNHGVEGCSG